MAYQVNRSTVERVKRLGAAAIDAALAREAASAANAVKKATRLQNAAHTAQAQATHIGAMPHTERLEALVRAVRGSPLGNAGTADVFCVSLGTVHHYRGAFYAARFPFTAAEHAAKCARATNPQTKPSTQAIAIARAMQKAANVPSAGAATSGALANAAPLDTREGMVRAIRLSPETNGALAARLGMSAANVKAIRTGRSHAAIQLTDQEYQMHAWRGANRRNRVHAALPTLICSASIDVARAYGDPAVGL